MDATCEVHCFAAPSRWLELLWTLKSFYASSGAQFRLCIHESATLTDEIVGILASHFPHGRVVLRNRSDDEVIGALDEYPNLSAMREECEWVRKLTDVAVMAEAPKVLVLDPSVLFFAPPDALLTRAREAFHNAVAFCPDMQSEYGVSHEEAEEWFGVRMLPLVSAAVVLAPTAALRLDWLEEFCARLRGQGRKTATLESTVFSLVGSRYGAELLSSEYAHDNDMPADHKICRRYSGWRSHRFYGEGLRELSRQGLLRHLRAES